MKPFFEVFPQLETDPGLRSEFAAAQVSAVTHVRMGNFVRVKINSSNVITTDHFARMERAIEHQVLDSRIRVKLEYENGYEFADESSAFGMYDRGSDLVAQGGGGSSRRSAGSGTASASSAQAQTAASAGGFRSDGKKFSRRKKETEEGMIYGCNFSGEPTPISDIVMEMRNVIVRGEIFESELTETRKGTKIFKASITDHVDSISLKMFLSEGEEELPEKFKEGTLILVKGKVEYDNYEGELMISRVEAVKPLEGSLQTRLDRAPVKRVELHLHTSFSDMDALTDIGKLMDRAASWGHTAMAITDHGVVQGFPVAFHKLQDLQKKYKAKEQEFNFKLIYGCEGYLVDDDDDPIAAYAGDGDVELIRRSAIPGEEEPVVSPELAAAIASVKKKKRYHIILLAKNEIGRVNLYRLISYAHINYYNRRPRIPRSVLVKYREGLVIGSACVMGELMDHILDGAEEEKLKEIVDFYDYLEIQPLGNNAFLVRNYETDAKGHKVKDRKGLEDLNRRVLELGDKYGKKVVATGDVHFLDPEDAAYRAIIEDSQNFPDADNQAPLYFRTTEEMLEEFAYLGDRAYEVVVTNTNLIADQIEVIEPVRPDKCPPVIENSEQKLQDIVYETARSMYGQELPKIVEDRLQIELNSIISNGYAVMYIIARELVQKSVSDGYLVGSRGSVGSSLVARMSGITEVNSLKAHYRCPKCLYSDFDSEEVLKYNAMGASGCDMPDKYCPVCGELLLKDGFDIPFETFLGFSGDKEPDIDLNFSGEYQSHAHDYTEVIFGKGHTFRAGTIATLQDKTVYGYVKKYAEKHGRQMRKCEVNRLIKGCVGVKRSTGQHPGGIVVLPHGEEIYSFTPVQHPANDASKNTVTTHFEYHSIDHNLLKLDILGHDDPTMIKMLEDLTGFSAQDVLFDNPDVLSLFESPARLGIKPEDINGYETGTLGVPEFGTDFVIRMLLDTKPKNFSDLVRIAGLSHGTDVWTSNAETLVKEGKATLSTCICTRDDIMLYLINMGLEPATSFKIMEKVRKGKGLTPEWEAEMRAHNVPDWYIWSCNKIQYMFPKAHACAYVMMGFRIAYYKIFYPLAYYAAFFSIRAKGFNYETMCLGEDALLENMDNLKKKIDRGEGTDNDSNTYKTMHNVLEMYARGYEFLPLDVYQAGATRFRIIDGKLMPSFMTLDGMGEKAALALEEEAKKEKFTSREDMRVRAKVSATMSDKLYQLGALGNLPESSQISFSDLFTM